VTRRDRRGDRERDGRAALGFPDTELREVRDRIRSGDREQRWDVADAPDHRRGGSAISGSPPGA